MKRRRRVITLRSVISPAVSRADAASSPGKLIGSDPRESVNGACCPIVSTRPSPLTTARVRSIPGNTENGPSDATCAMLTRQSKLSSDAPAGATAISVVEPPPFFHGVVRQSLARMIFTAWLASAQARQVELVFPGAIDRQLIAGVGMAHHAGGGIVP